jgi:hypothetical protein
VLIDQALRESNWDLLDPHRVRFESSGRDGRADYVLLGKNGPLCVLEAKRPDADPYEAKEQARGYAENVGAPFIVLSNGRQPTLPRFFQLTIARSGILPLEDASFVEVAWHLRVPDPFGLSRGSGFWVHYGS